MQPYEFTLKGSYDFAGQMNADLQERAQKYFREQDAVKDSFQSISDFENHRNRVKASLLESIGGLPEAKTPLNARVTGTIDGSKFTIEKVLFESLPDYLVSALCYVPKGLTAKAPAIVFFCGHSGEGKAYSQYQKVCRDLAANGFVVLAVDPIGQGERLQYLRDGEDTQKSCTIEHTHAGFQFLLQGASVARHFIWDGIRAVDYLCERPDVDNERIGVTGNSGGGTQTSLLMLCEPRLAAAVPGTFITSLEEIMYSGGPQDMEQIVRNAIKCGPDHDDFLTGIAPRPAMLGAVSYDFFPIEGSLRTFERAQKVYRLYNKPDNIAMVSDPSVHCYSDGLRQAAVNFFKQHLKGEAPDFVTSNPVPLEADTLNVTSAGNVLQEYPQSRSIADLIQESLQTIEPQKDRTPQQLRQELTTVLGVDQAGNRDAAIYPRIIEFEHDGFHGERIWFFSAPRIMVGGALFFPQKTSSKVLSATIVTLENGTADLPENMDVIKVLLQQGKAVYVFDPRGIGAVAPRVVSTYEATRSMAAVFNTEYKFGTDAAMLGFSTVGLRVFDILRAFDYLHSREDIGDIELYGSGHAATWSYLATVLEDKITSVTCKDMLLSYRQLCQTKFYDHERFNLQIMAWGLLRTGDLQDFLPCIAPRPISIVSPRNSENQVIDSHWS